MITAQQKTYTNRGLFKLKSWIVAVAEVTKKRLKTFGHKRGKKKIKKV